MFQMGKHLPETKKSHCEATYQKFHSKIFVLGILLLPSTHHIGSKIPTKIPSGHSKPLQKLTSIASQ